LSSSACGQKYGFLKIVYQLFLFRKWCFFFIAKIHEGPGVRAVLGSRDLNWAIWIGLGSGHWLLAACRE